MKVPPWDCYTAEDRWAFEFFVMQKLGCSDILIT